MIKKSTMALLALIVLMVIVSGCTTNNNNTQNNTQNISNQSNNNSNTTNTTNGTNLISAEKAKSIAQQYIEEQGVTAGTPVLQTINGNKVYVVPLIQNGQNVGEIEIDAVTGENLGGAGGAP